MGLPGQETEDSNASTSVVQPGDKLLWPGHTARTPHGVVGPIVIKPALPLDTAATPAGRLPLACPLLRT